jgi:hypothetical protein
LGKPGVRRDRHALLSFSRSREVRRAPDFKALRKPGFSCTKLSPPLTILHKICRMEGDAQNRPADELADSEIRDRLASERDELARKRDQVAGSRDLVAGVRDKLTDADEVDAHPAELREGARDRMDAMNDRQSALRDREAAARDREAASRNGAPVHHDS